MYVFPGDCKFEKVKQSKDRVYLLEFKTTKQLFFYWFQDDDKEKDAEISQKIHNNLNGIETPVASTTNGAATNA